MTAGMRSEAVVAMAEERPWVGAGKMATVAVVAGVVEVAEEVPARRYEECIAELE